MKRSLTYEVFAHILEATDIRFLLSWKKILNLPWDVPSFN